MLRIIKYARLNVLTLGLSYKPSVDVYSNQQSGDNFHSSDGSYKLRDIDFILSIGFSLIFDFAYLLILRSFSARFFGSLG
jgi:uncharacterized membrane protein YagU involved in acid resistance